VAATQARVLLFLNNHDGTFREEGTLRGVAYSDDGQDRPGMGVRLGDSDATVIWISETNFAGALPVLLSKNSGKLSSKM